MNLATLDITKEQAESALVEYRKLLVDDRTEEDRAIAQAYRAAARGLAIIRLSEAFKIAGHFPTASNRFIDGVKYPGLPRLAICRADAQVCRVGCDGDDFVFSSDRYIDNRGALVGKNTVRVPGANVGHEWARARTMVPLIPPQHRPRRHRMRGFHLLWEVESWTMEPPKDPALVRHLRGDLWSVLAVWDLTELERAVLTQRA